MARVMVFCVVRRGADRETERQICHDDVILGKQTQKVPVRATDFRWQECVYEQRNQDVLWNQHWFSDCETTHDEKNGDCTTVIVFFCDCEIHVIYNNVTESEGTMTVWFISQVFLLWLIADVVDLLLLLLLLLLLCCCCVVVVVVVNLVQLRND